MGSGASVILRGYYVISSGIEVLLRQGYKGKAGAALVHAVRVCVCVLLCFAVKSMLLAKKR